MNAPIKQEHPLQVREYRRLYVEIYHHGNEYIFHIWSRIPKPLFAIGLPLVKDFSVANVKFFPTAEPFKDNVFPGAFVVYASDSTPLDLYLRQFLKYDSIMGKSNEEIRKSVARELQQWNKMYQEWDSHERKLEEQASRKISSEL